MIVATETLTNEQLCSFAQTGNAQAREQLIENNLPFVRQNANKLAADPYRRERLASCGIDVDDLVQTGAIGLWQAIDSYDPTSGNKFLSYAAPAIKRAMLDLIEQYSRDTIGPFCQTALLGLCVEQLVLRWGQFDVQMMHRFFIGHSLRSFC